MLEKLVTINRSQERTGIHASDFGKMSLDLFFRMTGVPETNPPQWYDKLKWGAGLGVEKELLQVLKDSGIVFEEYDQDVHGIVERTIDGVLFTGHMDGNTTLDQTGEPIEIKSINNKNAWDIEKYKNNFPRENYVGQLAMYCYLTGSKKGHLFVSSIDGLNNFYFECNDIGDGNYKCGETIVNIPKEVNRLIHLYKNHVLTGVMPELWEYEYKYNIETVDWDKVSNDKISKARTGKAVLGDWQVQWSNWKDKIVELQGQTLGYSMEEIVRIKELTAGYSAKS